jgi:hypothetical protein
MLKTVAIAMKKTKKHPSILAGDKLTSLDDRCARAARGVATAGGSMDYEACAERRKRFLNQALMPSIASTTTSTNNKTVASRR